MVSPFPIPSYFVEFLHHVVQLIGQGKTHHLLEFIHVCCLKVLHRILTIKFSNVSERLTLVEALELAFDRILGLATIELLVLLRICGIPQICGWISSEDGNEVSLNTLKVCIHIKRKPIHTFYVQLSYSNL